VKEKKEEEEIEKPKHMSQPTTNQHVPCKASKKQIKSPTLAKNGRAKNEKKAP
jgi:hypothetical protein